MVGLVIMAVSRRGRSAVCSRAEAPCHIARSRPAIGRRAIGILVAVLVLAACGSSHRPAPHMPSHHALGGGFRNTVIERPGRDFAILLDLARHIGDFASYPVPEGHVMAPDRAVEMLVDNADADSVTWIGHATVLLRLSGRTILLDPLYSDTISPVPWAVPPRLVAPALAMEDLPPIDVIVVSHDHYDHFDPETIAALSDPERTQCVMPLEVGRSEPLGCAGIHRLDWHDSVEIGELTITALPARHFSGRGLLDRNSTLWASFAFRSGDRAVYYSGDTGYGPHFSEIGRRHGSFDLAIMSTGGYEPRSVVGHIHMNPEEAVRAAIELRARAMLPVHWGTFELGAEDPFETRSRVLAAAEALANRQHEVWTLAIGETRPIEPRHLASVE